MQPGDKIYQVLDDDATLRTVVVIAVLDHAIVVNDDGVVLHLDRKHTEETFYECESQAWMAIADYCAYAIDDANEMLEASIEKLQVLKQKMALAEAKEQESKSC